MLIYRYRCSISLAYVFVAFAICQQAASATQAEQRSLKEALTVLLQASIARGAGMGPGMGPGATSESGTRTAAAAAAADSSDPLLLSAKQPAVSQSTDNGKTVAAVAATPSATTSPAAQTTISMANPSTTKFDGLDLAAATALCDQKKKELQGMPQGCMYI